MFAIQWDYDEKDNWQYLTCKPYGNLNDLGIIRFATEDDAKYIMDILYEKDGKWGDFNYRIVDYPVRKVTAEADS